MSSDHIRATGWAGLRTYEDRVKVSLQRWEFPRKVDSAFTCARYARSFGSGIRTPDCRNRVRPFFPSENWLGMLWVAQRFTAAVRGSGIGGFEPLRFG